MATISIELSFSPTWYLSKLLGFYAVAFLFCIKVWYDYACKQENLGQMQDSQAEVTRLMEHVAVSRENFCHLKWGKAYFLNPEEYFSSVASVCILIAHRSFIFFWCRNPNSSVIRVGLYWKSNYLWFIILAKITWCPLCGLNCPVPLLNLFRKLSHPMLHHHKISSIKNNASHWKSHATIALYYNTHFCLLFRVWNALLMKCMQWDI